MHIDKVNNFLMELGTGIYIYGAKVRIEVGETEKFIDILFITPRHLLCSGRNQDGKI